MPPPPPNPPPQFVSRGGLKLRHALDTFNIDVTGLRCADLGCSTGGFTDCLLQAAAAHVTAVDTGYGILAWKLRIDPRVQVIERSNALHVIPPECQAAMDLVVIDLGWTPQRLCIPVALKWLKPGGQIISLIKPHYEDKVLADKHHGVLPDEVGAAVAERVLGEMAALGVRVEGSVASPVRGSGGKAEGKGNIERLALLTWAG